MFFFSLDFYFFRKFIFLGNLKFKPGHTTKPKNQRILSNVWAKNFLYRHCSPIAISLGSYMDKAAGRRACTGKQFTQDVSVCLGDVSVMSRSCLGRVSVLSLSFFGDVSVLFWCCLGLVSVMSRCCFGDVSVMSRSCLGLVSVFFG